MNKRGQFFILAAVIIASVVVGLASTKTITKVRDSQELFYSTSDEIYYEANQVLNHDIYTNQSNIEDFLDSAYQDASARIPGFQMLAVYDKNSKTIIKNNLDIPIEYLEGQHLAPNKNTSPLDPQILTLNIGEDTYTVDSTIKKKVSLIFLREVMGEKHVTIK